MVTSPASRRTAIDKAYAHFDSGGFQRVLARRVAYRTESQQELSTDLQRLYLLDEIEPALAALGFESRIVENPAFPAAPLLMATRHEGPHLPTVLTYGHGDVVPGYAEQWRNGLAPWELVVEGDRWYGRGTADNKGQHSINLAALAAVLSARDGRLGYNVKLVFESGEEVGSPGLKAVCAAERDTLKADLFLASDGPRVCAERPTLFLGSRGDVSFRLTVKLRDGAHHSGNWGGILRNPVTVLAHALATLVDRDGRIMVDGLRPPPVSDAIRAALADIELGRDDSSPAIDMSWGEPGLSPAERVIAWNALDVLAIKAANSDAPINAIPAAANAVCGFRFVVGTDVANLARHLRVHFDAYGFDDVQVAVGGCCPATRLDLDNPWVKWALESLAATTGKRPALLPNLGGTIPNDVFSETLKLPTLWVPHSYPACSQHAPDEHLLGSVVREALAVMAGLWWDLGVGTTKPVRYPATN